MDDPFDGLVGHQKKGAAPSLGHFEGVGDVAQTSSQAAWPGMAGASPRWQQHQQQQQQHHYPRPSGVSVSAALGGVRYVSHAGETQNISAVDALSSAASAQPTQQPPSGGYAAYPAYSAHHPTPPGATPWVGAASGTLSYGGGGDGGGGGGGGGGSAPSFVNTAATYAVPNVLHPALGFGGQQRNQQAASHHQQHQHQQQHPGYYNPKTSVTAAFHGQRAFLSASAVPQPDTKTLASPRADGHGGGSGGGTMGRGGTGVAAGAEWTPPADQLHVYEDMFQVASASSAVSGTVSGRAAVQFFSRSGLPKDSLKSVSWLIGTCPINTRYSYEYLSTVAARCAAYLLIGTDTYLYRLRASSTAVTCSGIVQRSRLGLFL